MRIVLTGATGFLGKAISRKLVAEGHSVCALVRPDSNQKVVEELGIHNVLHYTSLKDAEVAELLSAWKPESMLHLAWKGVTGNQRNDTVHFTENIPFTLDTITLASKTGCRYWMGMGSQAEYGVPNKRVCEEEQCRPLSAYGKAKLATGIASLGLCETLGLQGAWCRVFSVYGPEDHATTFISYLIQCFQNNQKASLTDCEQKWDYLYIADTADAIYELVKRKCTGIYNIGSGSTVRLKKVVECIKKELKSEQSVGYGEKASAAGQIRHLQADVSKLMSETGWRPTVTLAKGLHQTISFFQKKIQNESI